MEQSQDENIAMSLHVLFLKKCIPRFDYFLVFLSPACSNTMKLFRMQKEVMLNLHPQLQLPLINKNVAEVEKAILNAYNYDTPELPHRTLKASLYCYWGFMHDGISNFGKEFNGLYKCQIDESYEPINVPYHLSKMKGEVTGFDLGLHLFFKFLG